MSTLMDGINNVYSLTAQIEALRSANQQNIDDPEALRYALEQNFNQMLNDLVASTSEEDEDEDKNDPFSFFISSNQASLQSLQAQGILESSDAQPLLENSYNSSLIPDLNSPEYLNALYYLGQL